MPLKDCPGISVNRVALYVACSVTIAFVIIAALAYFYNPEDSSLKTIVIGAVSSLLALLFAYVGASSIVVENRDYRKSSEKEFEAAKADFAKRNSMMASLTCDPGQIVSAGETLAKDSANQ